MDSEILIPIGCHEIMDNLTSSCNEDITECNQNENNSKVFLCHICNKEYRIYFHLKQHIKKVHGEKKNYYFHNSNIQNDQKLDENEIATKSIPNANNLTIHEGQKAYICESCGKSFSEAQNLKRHIQTVHEGHNDYKLSLIHI